MFYWSSDRYGNKRLTVMCVYVHSLFFLSLTLYGYTAVFERGHDSFRIM